RPANPGLVPARGPFLGRQDAEIEPISRFPAPRGFSPDCLDPARQVDPRVYGKPAVAILDHPLGNPLRPRSQEYGRSAGLHGLGPAPEGSEIHELAVVLGDV